MTLETPAPRTAEQAAAFSEYLNAKRIADMAYKDEVNAYWRWTVAMGWMTFKQDIKDSLPTGALNDQAAD